MCRLDLLGEEILLLVGVLLHGLFAFATFGADHGQVFALGAFDATEHHDVVDRPGSRDQQNGQQAGKSRDAGRDIQAKTSTRKLPAHWVMGLPTYPHSVQTLVFIKMRPCTMV